MNSTYNSTLDLNFKIDRKIEVINTIIDFIKRNETIMSAELISVFGPIGDDIYIKINFIHTQRLNFLIDELQELLSIYEVNI
ncbi:hypothetical protein [Vagococcus carniphilus]|uniref:hypothetical protein n=1 Tax=Vagococcus carniphilus TaxID=218144 RepID=UPI003B5C3147